MLIEDLEDIAVGHAEIDADHRHLIALLNRLHEAVLAGRNDAEILAILTELAGFSTRHFGREEQLMAEFGYPGHDIHRWAHESFIHELSEIIRAFEAGEQGIDEDTRVTLKRWVLDHVGGLDRDLALFLRRA